jgi:hypothetical protein
MLADITEVRPLGEHRLFLRFDGVFAPLADPSFFAQAKVDGELGTIVWPNGADLCPDVLHSRLTGQPVPAMEPQAKAS